MIALNRAAKHEYEVLDSLECGVVLVGSEVKSLRRGKVSVDEAYGRIKGNEVWLINCDIPEYLEASRFNHEPKRPRKLLLHRREIRKFASKAYEKGLTLVPLKLYFKEGKVKVLLGICKGKKLFDKRETMKKATMQREIDRALRRNPDERYPDMAALGSVTIGLTMGRIIGRISVIIDRTTGARTPRPITMGRSTIRRCIRAFTITARA